MSKVTNAVVVGVTLIGATIGGKVFSALDEQGPASDGIAHAQTQGRTTHQIIKNRGVELPAHFEDWERNMTRFGDAHGKALDPKALGSDGNLTEEQLYAIKWYDPVKAFLNIYDYTGDQRFNQYAEKAVGMYGVQYVQDGKVPGYSFYTAGLRDYFERTGDKRAKDAIGKILQHGMYIGLDESEQPTQRVLEELKSFKLSREAALSIKGYLDAEAIGFPHSPRLEKYVDLAVSHLDQYMAKGAYYKPFFIALTMTALIQYIEEGHPTPEREARILERLPKVAAQMFKACWDEEKQAMKYISRPVEGEDPPDPAPDLGPMTTGPYGWLHMKNIPVPADGPTDPTTHKPMSWIQMGDKIFSGGAPRYDTEGFHQGGAFIGDLRNPISGEKQFVQVYFDFRYLIWTGRLSRQK